MARILLATVGSYGDVNPYLALGVALKARGHDPVVATMEPYRADVEGAGIGFAPVGPEFDLADADLLRRVMDARTGPETVIRELVVPALRRSHADLERAAEGADLLVSHVLTFAVPILAEERGLPWVSTVLSPMVFFSPHDPPVPPPFPALGRLRVLGPGFNGLLVGLYKRVSRSWTDPVRAFRRERGLPPGEDPLFAGQHSPHGVLGLFSPVFGAPQPDWPPRTRVCGFLFRDEDFLGKGMDPALERFLGEGPPPVVFTLGSSAVMTAEGFYEDAAAAVRELGCRAVLLAGAAAEGMTGLPAGVLALPSAPYHALFPRAAAVVHSVGVGTTAQALRAGRPQLAIPHSHDQFDNAARLERLGVGATVYRKRVTPGRLVKALRPMLADGAMRARAEAIGKRVAAEDGAAEACAGIEAVLGSLKSS